MRRATASRPNRRRACLLAGVGAVAVAGWLGGFGASAAVPLPRCFGAASRDPYRACHNPQLARLVIPTPAEAQITPNSPCAPVGATINLCEFAAPAQAASGTIALVGDSHAWHWRAAVAVAAEALNWHGLDSTRSSCPFTRGTPIMPEPKLAGCLQWNQRLLRWFRTRPDVSTVFTSDHPGPVTTAPGQSALAAQVAGISAAWAALPKTVRHIVVIRDIPYMHGDTLACIEAAVRKHEDAGATCAVPRAQALKPDPATIAAQHSQRAQVVDLTPFFCDSRLCYPVVGGALVYRDEDHLTGTFAATVGPFLLHALGKLMASWR